MHIQQFIIAGVYPNLAALGGSPAKAAAADPWGAQPVVSSAPGSAYYYYS